MSRQGSTGVIKVAFLPSVTTLAGVTAAACIAGVDLTPYMRRDGIDTPRSASVIDASDASTRVNKSIPGNIETGSLTYRGFRDSVIADDDAWAALPEDAAGAFVVRRFGGSTSAFAATQHVEAYVGTVSTRAPQQIGDEAQNFLATFTYEASSQDLTLA